MLKRLSRRTCLKKYPLFPKSSPRVNRFFFPEIVGNYVITISAKTETAHIKMLAIEICKLLHNIGIDSILCLGDYPLPWRYQAHNHKPVVKALDYLIKNGIAETFDGAIEVSIQELPEFLVHLYWLQRCCATLPDFHFMDKGQSIVGHICKYGNLHLGIINEETASTIAKQLKNTGLVAMTGKC
jgi:hypothetical protein